MQPRIMYIDEKANGLSGTARIGRVSFSDSGKSLYYAGYTLRSLKGYGYKANYYDVATGRHFWDSGCKKSGDDRLYPGIVEIDEDVREEYWRDIRGRSDLIAQSSFRSEGKHTRRKPK